MFIIDVCHRYQGSLWNQNWSVWTRASAQILWGVPDFSGVHILPCEKENSLGLEIFNRIGKTIKKL